jgi:hypothetical protein
MRISVLIILSMGLLQGCAARMTLAVDRERVPRQPDCSVEILKDSDVALSRYEQLGTVTFGDTGVSLICDRPAVEKLLRAQGCKVGANAALIVHEEQPDLWSTCYRVAAKLVWLNN